ncbi:helix-turn-helix transcriptional regulator [Aliidiomarina sanyensis]|nr:WYL domain-containing protein [Aliidiomarina sanyensis]
MSAQGIRSTITRQWELLKLLPSRAPGLTSKALAMRLNDEGLSVSKRTVERDLTELSCLFPIQCNDRSKPYGWYWQRDASLDIPGISMAEALSLRLIEETVRPLLPHSVLESVESRFLLAKEKLSSLGDDQPLLSWSKKVAHVPAVLQQIPPYIDPVILETVQTGLLKERCVEVMYQSVGKAQPHTMCLHPLALVQRGTVTYLIARVNDYKDERIFALHRVMSAELTEQAIHNEIGFDLKAYLAGGAFQFSTGERIELTIRVYNQDVIQLLRESPLSEDQRIIDHASELRVQATVSDSWQLRWWLMSWGEHIEVQEPLALRKELGQRLVKAAEFYVDSLKPGNKE